MKHSKFNPDGSINWNEWYRDEWDDPLIREDGDIYEVDTIPNESKPYRYDPEPISDEEQYEKEVKNLEKLGLYIP